MRLNQSGSTTLQGIIDGWSWVEMDTFPAAFYTHRRQCQLAEWDDDILMPLYSFISGFDIVHETRNRAPAKILKTEEKYST